MCNNSTIKNIVNNWKADALKEDISKYFYSYEEVDSVLSGQLCYVIGRKGSGKSALCKHVMQQEKNHYNIFAESLSFKSYPINELFNYGRKNQSTNYLALWKYIMFLKICKMFKRNGIINIQDKAELNKIFPEYKPSELQKEISEWKPDSFTIKLANLFDFASLVEAKVGMKNNKRKSSLTLSQKAEIIEEIVLSKCDKESIYYLVFDELDEEYKFFRDLSVGNKYHELIVGLLRAVEYVKTFDN